MKIDHEHWGRLSALLDEALEIDIGQREAWLQTLPGDVDPLKDQLRRLLAQQARIETGEFQRTPDFAAALRSETARSLAAPIELLAGSEVGAYRLVRELGRGGMGSVWLAERIDGKFKRQVALKFPYAGPNQRQLAERLARERDILASLEHPNIARLYDADVTPLGQPFLVLEYVDGIPINEYCDRHGLTIRERLVLFLQVLNAVQYAHTRLVIHRDIKPSNVSVTADGGVHLLDFGIAKIVVEGQVEESPLTEFGGRALTPDYASPEQIGGRPLTTASDIYSLGVVLYELLAGARPYRLSRDSRASLEEAIAEADVIAPSRAVGAVDTAVKRSARTRQLVRELRGDLDTIVLKALKKKADERYVSVDAFSQDIARHLDGEPVSAQPDSAWYRARKLLGRHRLAAAFSVAIALTIIVSAAIAVHQAREATTQAQRLGAVKDFLVDVFNANSSSQADPLKAQQTTARELLDRASERLPKQLTDAPEVAEDLLNVLTTLYLDLGLDAKGAELAKQRLELARRIFGRRDGKTIDALIVYGGALYATDDWKLALTSFDEAEHLLNENGDSSSRQRAKLQVLLSEYWRDSDLEKSRAYAAQAVALFRKYYPEDPGFAEALRIAGEAEQSATRYAVAEPFYQEALDVQQRIGVAEIQLIKPLIQLADVQKLLLQYDRSEKNFQRGIEISRRVNGERHIDTIQSEFRYGTLLRNIGKFRQSQQLLSGAERTAVSLLGETESFHLPLVRIELARTERVLGNLESAEDLLKRAIAVRESTRGDTRAHAAMLLEYARLLVDFGRNEESRRLAAQAADIYSQVNMPLAATDLPVVMSMNYIASGQSTKALEVLDRFAADRERMPLGTQVRSELVRAQILGLTGKSHEAEQLLRAQLARLGASAVHMQMRSLESDIQMALGRLLVADSRPTEAQEFLRTSLQWRMQELDANSPALAEAEVVLADCLIALGAPNEARPLLLKAQAAYDKHPQLGVQFLEPLRNARARLTTTKS